MRKRERSSSPAWRADFQPPEPPSTASWRLEPLRPELNEQDHAAWASCRERLVQELDWKGWPAPDFTLQDNHADLAEHYAEFLRREAYAWSVLRGERCLGCVYVEPWSSGAQLAFWVIDEALPLEAELLCFMLDWLASWPFEQVVVPVRPQHRRGRQVLASLGLREVQGPPGFVSYAR